MIANTQRPKTAGDFTTTSDMTQARTTPASPAAPRGRMFAAVVGIAVVAIGACIAGVANAFTLDDVTALLHTQRLHDFSEWKAMLTERFGQQSGMERQYRPLLSLFMALQSVAGDTSIMLFRFVSYLLYAATCVAVFRLARRWLPDSVAAGIGLLFAAHPLHVESTALAVAQGDLLAALIAAVIVTRYIDRCRAGGMRAIDWAFAGVLYAVASLTNEVALVLPLLLLIAEMFLATPAAIGAGARREWKGHVALAVIAVAALALRARFLGANGSDAIAAPVAGVHPFTVLKLVPDWLRLMIWPQHLRADYSPRELVASTGLGPRELLGLVLVAASAFLGWRLRRRAPAVGFGLAWAAVTLPAATMITAQGGTLIAERALILPSIGMMVAVGGLVALLLEQPMMKAVSMRRGVAAAAGILIALGLVKSVQRQRAWYTPATITVASVKDAPRSWRVQLAYGELLFDYGQGVDGLAAYNRSIQLAPETWRPRNALAARMRGLGDDAAALRQLKQSLAENPGRIETVNEMAPTLIALGRYQEAIVLADSVIIANQSAPEMMFIRRLADSAIAVGARPGTIRVRMPKF